MSEPEKLKRYMAKILAHDKKEVITAEVYNADEADKVIVHLKNEIRKVADYFLKHEGENIIEGSACDNAIAFIKTLQQQLSEANEKMKQNEWDWMRYRRRFGEHIREINGMRQYVGKLETQLSEKDEEIESMRIMQDRNIAPFINEAARLRKALEEIEALSTIECEKMTKIATEALSVAVNNSQDNHAEPCKKGNNVHMGKEKK